MVYEVDMVADGEVKMKFDDETGETWIEKDGMSIGLNSANEEKSMEVAIIDTPYDNWIVSFRTDEEDFAIIVDRDAFSGVKTRKMDVEDARELWRKLFRNHNAEEMK